MVSIKGNWRVTQKYLRITHNKAVKTYFKNVDNVNNTYVDALRIYSKDTANQCIAKMKLFEGIKSQESFAPLIPEWWQVRKGADVPQLVVVFKPKSSTRSNLESRWSLSLPHFINDPDKVKHITGYKKGSVQGILTLKDNSKIIIYAKNKTEVKKTLKNWTHANLFDPNYLDKKNLDLKIGEINTQVKFKEIEVIPAYSKYFSTGQKNLAPNWVLSL